MVRHASCAYALSVSLLCTSALAGRGPFGNGLADFEVEGGEPGPRGAPATSDLRGPGGVNALPADLSSGDCEDQVKGTDTRSRVLTSGQKLKLLPSDQDSKYDYVNYYIYASAGEFKAYTMTNSQYEAWGSGQPQHYDDGYTTNSVGCYIYRHGFPGFDVPDNDYLVVGIRCTAGISCDLETYAIFGTGPIDGAAQLLPAPAVLGVAIAIVASLLSLFSQ